ncbi:hypothetical protein SERLA73DRAFT_181952 [Serpula lacrymans var. lacrymans S7.3]|uniref:Uncharacterized protein n=2 Tax=Serpula lacrymans var. lacrymans TaxID=341189 RepID=F8PZ23_SERL3|nr:uncharacterized protein SERLADRAFT_468377 [Serpula lacrymans var. lacrymans S7.9]EGN99136.1 hypothetical protein SERLA73DRAFT_181952 [Serpula lacrymans var. lacrymans S7.3]EGO24704.1 hypothetical protein SERLADRAFT_468377 [Serpula lacrymans var. lacrymans S7.9]
MAWPELERLSLRSSPWNTGALTLSSLLLLLKHSPGLREIEIFFDATSVPSTDEFGGDWPCNKNIKEIYLSDSSIADPCSVVAFLCAVLPNLTGIHCNDLDVKDVVSECFEKQRKSVGV